jgi:hypothetical protein
LVDVTDEEKRSMLLWNSDDNDITNKRIDDKNEHGSKRFERYCTMADNPDLQRLHLLNLFHEGAISRKQFLILSAKLAAERSRCLVP